MAFRFPTVLVAALACAALAAPSAGAAGIQQQRAVEAPLQRLAAATPWIAPPSACPGQNSLDAPAQVQEQAMRCMTEFARLQAGREGFVQAGELDFSARSKSEDILRCDSFSHFACGREFSFWIREAGYMSTPCWRVGENIAWGQGEYGTVRSIFQAWMRSPTHRQNILGDFDQLGLGLRIGAFGERGETSVWTQHFGSQCGDAA